ncbi:hypothetical protein AZZ60_004819 [Escherichia coli]|nr:hypothetical protein AZZ60_004819 [Escherichia coli]
MGLLLQIMAAVSYTHLDVYKRQVLGVDGFIIADNGSRDGSRELHI